MPSFSDLDTELGLPAGSVARKAATKHAGDSFICNEVKLVKISETEARRATGGSGGQRTNQGGEAEDDEGTRAQQQAAMVQWLADRHRRTNIWLRYDTSSAMASVNPDTGEVTLADPEQLRAQMCVDLHGLVSLSEGRTVASATFDLLRMTPVRQSSVVPVLWANDPWGYCWRRLKVTNEPLSECPSALAEILARCATPAMADGLVQWIGSLMDNGSDRTQYLAFHGEGNDGKSSLFEALQSIFGSTYTQSSAEEFRGSHATASFEGQRLVVFTDENNTRFYSSGPFKALVGDKHLKVNPKNQNMRTVAFNGKVIVSTNHQPSLDGGKADKRRLLYVRIASHKGGPDDTFKPRMVAEAGDMMRYCYTKWLEWKAAHPIGGFLGDADAVEELLMDSPAAMAQELFEELFTVDPAASTPIAKVIEYLDRRTDDILAIKKVRALLNSQFRREPKWLEGKTVRVYVGLRFSELHVTT